LFSFKTNFFFAKTRDGFEGVQRRGPVKGAVCSRSSKTLDREHRWNNAGRERRGLSGEKMKKKGLRSEHRMEGAVFSSATGYRTGVKFDVEVFC
jgi:hypothetical protein